MVLPYSGFKVGGSTTITNVLGGSSVIKKTGSGVVEVDTSTNQTKQVGITSSSGRRRTSKTSSVPVVTQTGTPKSQGIIPVDKPEALDQVLKAGNLQEGSKISRLGVSLEQKYADFKTKFGGRELSASEYALAQREKVKLDVETFKYKQSYDDYLKRVGKTEASIKGLEQQRKLDSLVKARSFVEKPVILPGQKGYQDPTTKREKTLQELKDQAKKLPKFIDVGVSSKTRWVQLEEGKNLYVSPGLTGGYATKEDLEFSQEGYVRSAEASIVTPEDILMYTPALSSRFFGGVTGLLKKGASTIAPNIALKAKKFITPVVLKGSEKIKAFEKRTVEGLKINVEGVGKYSYKTQSPAKQFLGLQPKKIVQDISYKFNVAEKASFPKNLKISATGFKDLSPGQELLLSKQLKVKMGIVPKSLKGEPFTLSRKFQEEPLLELIQKRLDLRSGLRGESQFVSEGFVDVLKKGKVADRIIIKDVSRVVGKGEPTIIIKPTSLFVSPGKDIPTRTSFLTKLKSFGEVKGKGEVRGVLFDKDFGKFGQEIIESGKKISVKGSVYPGKVSDVFDFGKVKAFSYSSLGDLGGSNLSNRSVGQQIFTKLSPIVTKFSAASGLSKVVPKVSVPQITIPKSLPLVLSQLRPTSYLRTSFPERTSVRVKQDSVLKVTPFVETKQISLLRSVQEVKPIFKPVVEVSTSSSLKFDEGLNISSGVDVKQVQAEAYNVPERFVQVVKLAPIQRTGYVPKIVPPLLPVVPIIPSQKRKYFPFDEKDKRKKGKGFLTFIRKEGKTIRLTKTPLSYGLALKLGKQATRKGLSQSFFVKQYGVTKFEDIPTPSLAEYRQKKPGSRIKEQVFIEKNPLATKRETGLLQQAKKSSRSLFG